MTVLNKLDKFLDENSSDNDLINDYTEEDVLFEMMMDFIEILDPEILSEKQACILDGIVTVLADEDEEEINEVFKLRKRRDISMKRKRRRMYRRARAQIKLAARKYRRSAIGRKTARLAKRFKKFGRTSTRKRQKKWIGPNI